MKGRCGVDQPHVIGIHDVLVFRLLGEVFGEEAGISANALKMGAGFRIAGFGELGEGEDGEITGIQRKDTFGGADANGELRGIERLDHEFIRAGGETRDDVFARVPAGEKDHEDIAGKSGRANFPAQIEAGHLRHLPIRNHHADGFFAHDFDGFAAIGGFDDFMAAGVERMAKELQGDAVVVCDEYLHGRLGLSIQEQQTIEPTALRALADPHILIRSGWAVRHLRNRCIIRLFGGD